MIEDKKFYTIMDFAKEVKMSDASVRKAIHRGDLRAEKERSGFSSKYTYLIPASELSEYRRKEIRVKK